MNAGISYSPQWRTIFSDVDPEKTAAEVAFLARMLPLPGYRAVLDVPCGTGRHMQELADRGYRVVGVENDRGGVERARAAGLDARTGDVRKLSALGRFDAVICMWASFGWFDAETNEAVLGEFARTLRPGGRLVLDVYHPACFAFDESAPPTPGSPRMQLVFELSTTPP